jgi:serine/threonine-protein kinase
MRRLLDAIGIGRRDDESRDIGTVIAHRFRLVSSLGKCGAGERFIGQDEVNEEQVLVLVLPASFAGEQTAARLVRMDVSFGDARIVRPLAVGVDAQGRPYTVTRWLDAEPLTHVLARGVPRWALTFEVLEELCDMLAVAHKRGLCHGSLDPARIFVGREVGQGVGQGGPWLLDAGLANALARSVKGGFSMPGAVEYVAPELLAGKPPGPLSDLYSLAVILWEMVSGKPPYTGELAQVVEGHRNRPLPELVRRGDAPVEVETLLTIALAKAPEDRFNSTLELIETLRGIEASSSGVWSLSSLKPEASSTGGELSPTTEVGAMLRTFSVVELRATRDLIDKLLAARGG